MASMSASSDSDSQLKLWMPLGECVLHFVGGLADAREDHLRGIAAGLEHAEELAARNDIEAGAGLGQQRQNGQRGIGFDGVADGVGQVGEGGIVGAIVGQERMAGIDIGGRTHARGERGERDLLTVKVVLRIGKHRSRRTSIAETPSPCEQAVKRDGPSSEGPPDLVSGERAQLRFQFRQGFGELRPIAGIPGGFQFTYDSRAG